MTKVQFGSQDLSATADASEAHGTPQPTRMETTAESMPNFTSDQPKEVNVRG